VKSKAKGVHEVQIEDHDDPALYFDMVEIHELGHKAQDTQALISLTAESEYKTANLTFKIDTGAEGNVMPLATYKTLVPASDFDRSGIPRHLKPSTTRIMAYGGTKIPLYGTCELTLSHHNMSEKTTFYVVQTDGSVIIGLPTCRKLGLITLNYSISTDNSTSTIQTQCTTLGDIKAKEKILSEYGDVFQGIGCFKGEYSITVDPNVTPVIHPPRRVPVALQGPLKEELDSLTKKGILSEVKEPTDWVNSCVCVTKPNRKIRLSLDPKDLNRAIKRRHRYTPTLEDILSKLSGAKFFTILDARSGYWNVKLDEAHF